MTTDPDGGGVGQPDQDRDRDHYVGVVVAYNEAVGLGEVEVRRGGAIGAGGESGAGAGESGAGSPSVSATPAISSARPVRYQFHCTQIADGSRLVEVGAVVTFGLLAGRGGRWEAAGIRPPGDPDE